MRTRKSWREKLADSKGLPRMEKVSLKRSLRWRRGTFVIPASIEVDDMMKAVPAGKLVAINEIRAALAKKHHASFGCPITTGF